MPQTVHTLLHISTLVFLKTSRPTVGFSMCVPVSDSALVIPHFIRLINLNSQDISENVSSIRAGFSEVQIF